MSLTAEHNKRKLEKMLVIINLLATLITLATYFSNLWSNEVLANLNVLKHFSILV